MRHVVLKKPVFEAVFIDPNSPTPFAEMMAFTKELGVNRQAIAKAGSLDIDYVELELDDGSLTVARGTWLMRDGFGNYQMLLPHIFDQLYTEAPAPF